MSAPIAKVIACKSHSIRVLTIDEKPFFCVLDVMKICGVAYASKWIARHTEYSFIKKSMTIRTTRGIRTVQAYFASSDEVLRIINLFIVSDEIKEWIKSEIAILTTGNKIHSTKQAEDSQDHVDYRICEQELNKRLDAALCELFEIKKQLRTLHT